MWERPRVTESDHSVGQYVRARASGPSPWHDSSSAWQVFGASQRRSVKPRAGLQHKPREDSASPKRSSRSFEKPSACEPGAGSLLPFGGVRLRSRCGAARGVRQVWRRTRAAGTARRWPATSGLTRWCNDSRGRRAVPVRRYSASREARLWRQQRSAGRRQKSKAQSQPLGSFGRNRPSTSGSKACRFGRLQTSSGLPSRRYTATLRVCWRSPRRKPSRWRSKLARSRSSRSTAQSRAWTASSSEATRPPSWLSCASTSGERSSCISRKRKSSTRAPTARRCRSTNAGP